MNASDRIIRLRKALSIAATAAQEQAHVLYRCPVCFWVGVDKDRDEDERCPVCGRPLDEEDTWEYLHNALEEDRNYDGFKRHDD